MKKYFVKVYSVVLFLIGFLLIAINFNKMSLNGLFKLLEGNISQIIASVVIVIYLLVKSYTEMSSRNKTQKNFLKLLILFILSSIFVAKAVFVSSSGAAAGTIRIELIFRYVGIIGMIYILDYYVVGSFMMIKRVVFTTVLGFLGLFTLFFTLDSLPLLSSLYYFFAVIYCLIILTAWKPNCEKYGEKAKSIALMIISLTLLNDLIFIMFGKFTIELSFMGASIGIIIVYASKMFQKYNDYKSKQIEITNLRSRIKKMESEQDVLKKNASHMKQELFSRFNQKQSYFENLELVLDVLNTNVLVVNDQFNIELAYGNAFNYDDLIGKEISMALFDVLNDDAQYFQSVVKKIFEAKDVVRENLFLSLLDQKLSIENLLYDMDYFIMKKNNNERVLIMHAEITNNRTRHINGNQDKEVTNIVTAIVKNSEMFFSDLSTYLEFCKKLTFYVKPEEAIKDNVFRVLRKVHTFKSVFDQYNMYATVRGINEIENELFNMLHNAESLNNGQLTKLLIGYDLESVLRTDMTMLKHQLGERFFEAKKKMSVDIVSFERVYLALEETLGKEHKLLKEIEALKQVDICEILESYEEYVLRIAKDQGKLIRFNVTGDRVKVDRYELVQFFESLIHILKNSVTHGVEYPDERIDAGKDSTATINCHVRVVKNFIHLSISDDGKGIDVKEIKNRLFILGKYSIEEIDALSDDVVCNMVIEDGVTTLSLPNAIAGRGVGMGSVKETVEEIGGQISVDSKRGFGVSYKISLPLETEFVIELMNSSDIRENICLQTERLLTKSEKKSTLSSTWYIKEGKITSMVLKDVTAFIIIKGQIDRKIAITADEKFIYQLLNTYGLQVKYNGSNMKVMNEVMGMFIEEVVLKSVEELKGNRQNINIEPSCIMSAHMFEEQCEGHDGQHAHLEIAEGNMSILVIDGQLR